jgi:WhiB family redox-sensing transcriptional regulator
MGTTGTSESSPVGWRALARCRGMDTAIFFPEDDRPRRHLIYEPARTVCAQCPVVEECRQAGMGEDQGMWGGMSPTQRHPRIRSGARRS